MSATWHSYGLKEKAQPSFLNSLITNDIVTMKPGTMKYTLMCNPQGGIIDDLLVYKFSETLPTSL